MGKQTNTITINDQLFDATTGEKLSKSNAITPNLDGVVAPVDHKTIATVAPRPAKKFEAPEPAKPKKPVMDIARAAGATKKHRTQQKAKTLARAAVKKPAKSNKSSSNVTARSKHIPAVVVAPPARAVDEARLAEAQKVPQSQLIKHFSAVNIVPQANHPHAVHSSNKPKPVIDVVPRSAVIAPGQPVDRPTDIFAHALEKATAHEQPKLKTAVSKKQRSKHRTLRISGALLAVVLIGGFIAYQNMTAVTLALASRKAGFTASLPTSQPSGFSRSAVQAKAGLVAVSYHSNSDDRSFGVTEKASSWDSQTLRESIVNANAAATFQTVQAGGRTIFIYGNKSAAWVSGGVQYLVDSGGSLSDHQLIELATSIR